MALAFAPAPHITITLCSHYFSCSRLSARGREVVVRFLQRFLQWERKTSRGQTFSVVSKVFASANLERTEFRFHINALDEFKALMAQMYMTENLVQYIVKPPYEPIRYELKILPHWSDRPHQPPFIQYLSQKEPRAKLLELPTGTGKGYSSMRAMANVGQRVVAILRPKYMEKWEIELREIYQDFKTADGKPALGKVLQVSGSAELNAVLSAAADGALDYPFILIATNTLRNWLREYKRDGAEAILQKYPCLPEDMFQTLGAGVRLIDEGHEEFHFLFELDMYTHVPTSMTLTATLQHKDPFITRMYEVQFPTRWRMEKPMPKKLADVYNMLYTFKAPDKIQTEEYGQTTYSHTALEKSVMRHVPTLRNYTAMIVSLLRSMYYTDRKPGEKALVYAASVKMCSHLTNEIAKAFADLDVRRFVGTENDPYENLMQADICVSTVGRAGTAMDIPNLAVVLMTTALDSVQGNIQALGRLRERDGKMIFMFLTCENFAKHLRYAEDKKALFGARAKTFSTSPTGFEV